MAAFLAWLPGDLADLVLGMPTDFVLDEIVSLILSKMRYRLTDFVLDEVHTV